MFRHFSGKNDLLHMMEMEGGAGFSGGSPSVPQPAGETAAMAEGEGAASTNGQAQTSFASLAHLRRAHADMLRRYRADKEHLGTPEILAFLRQAQATGNHIAADEARGNAQGILDYWYGVLVMTGKETESSAEPFALAEYLPTTVPAESSHEEAARRQQALLKAAKAFDSALPGENQQPLQRLLIRLVRMSDNTGTKVDRAQLLTTDDLLADPGQAKLAAELADKGLLQMEAASTGAGKAYVLSDASLLKDWPTLTEVVDQRRSLREMTNGWEKSGQKEEALLPNGKLLECAANYTDLNRSELAFVRASENQAAALAAKEKKLQNILLSASVVILMSLAWSLYQRSALLTKQNEIEHNNTIVLTKQKEELQKQKDIAEAAHKAADEATKKAKEERDNALQAAAEIRSVNDKAEADRQKLKEELQKQKQLLDDKTQETKIAADNLTGVVNAVADALAKVDALKKLKGLSKTEAEGLTTALDQLQKSVVAAKSGQATAIDLADSTDEAATTAQYVAAQPQLPVKVLTGHRAPINAVTFAKDGRLATAGDDNLVRIWSPKGEKTGEPIQGSPKDGVNCLAFSPDGKRLAIGSNGSAMLTYDFDSGTAPGYDGFGDSITSVTFNEAGSLVLAASGDHTVRILDAQNLQMKAKYDTQKSIPTWAAFNPAATQVLASLDEPAKAAFLWTVGGDPNPTVLQAGSVVKGGQFSPDGTLIVTANAQDNEAVIWDAATGGVKARLKHAGPVFKAIFDPSGQRVATGSADMTAKIWDAHNGTLIRTLAGHTGHKGEIRQLAFSPDGKILLTGSFDATAKLWYEGETDARYTLNGHTRRITSVAFNADGSQAATGSYDGTVRLWDVGSSSKPGSTIGWSLYGWLDTKADQPTLRAQSFVPQTGNRSTIPEKGSIVTSEAYMNIRDSITAGPNKRWQQGHPVGVLLKGESVEVLDVQADPKAHPPAVWIQFKRK